MTIKLGSKGVCAWINHEPLIQGIKPKRSSVICLLFANFFSSWDRVLWLSFGRANFDYFSLSKSLNLFSMGAVQTCTSTQ